MTDSKADPLLFSSLDQPAAHTDRGEALDGPNMAFEAMLADQGCFAVAGTDEAGRGPLAGPVVAAAVILPFPMSSYAGALAGLNDSKALSKSRRIALFDAIQTHARSVSVCAISAETIDRTNILRASLEAMRLAVSALSVKADGVLVDGNRLPTFDGNPRVMTIVKGDARSMSIAAASIVAKVTRDRMMEVLGQAHPGYGLERHAGYASRQHRDAIAAMGGVARVHRFSFRPLKRDDDLLDQP